MATAPSLRTWTALAIGLLASATIDGLVAAQTAPTVEAGLDLTIKPGDDFYAYANGEWLKATQIPAGKKRWSDRNDFDLQVDARVRQLVTRAASMPPGTYQRKVADFYSAYMNEAAIESRGLEPVKLQLQQVDSLHDKKALASLLGRGLRMDVDPLNFAVNQSPWLFGLSVEPSLRGDKQPSAFLLQGGLGLADRDQYLDASPEKQIQRDRYQSHIAHVLELAGYKQPIEKAKAIMALENSIAKVQASEEESGKIENVDNRWSLADFSTKAPGIDWSAFFAAAGLSNRTDLVAYQSSAIAAESALVKSVSLDTWKDYLRFHVIDRYSDVLPKAFAQPSYQPQKARQDKAIIALNKALPDAVGHMYVTAYFPPESKAKVQAILANVLEVWERRIDQVQWMSPSTRALALAKLKVMYFDVGYPGKWTDYAALNIDAGDAYGNATRVADWDYAQALGRLGKPVDRTDWVVSPHTVVAVYLPQTNSYNMAAAFMQGIKFDPAAPDAVNYGSIGAIMGHEVSHFIDTLGADTDLRGATGAPYHWWTAEDMKHFEASSQPLTDQFSSYRSLSDAAVNGLQTRDENVADLGGLTASLEAFHRSLGSKVSDKAFVRQQDRLFFIGWARSSRMKISDDELRHQIATDNHAPQNFRVATVRNLDAWYDAFDVQPGQKLYLEPGARVHVW
jgi:putative endopeptidase